MAIQKVNVQTVLPSETTITQISVEVGFTNTNLNIEALKLLSATLDIHSESKEWDGVATNLVAWLSLPNRTPNIEAAYFFTLNFLTKASTSTKTKLHECIKSPQFWVAEKSSPEVTDCTLPILASIAFDKDLQSSEHASAAVKNYWKTNLPADRARVLFNRAYLANQLQIFWRLATDSTNSLAIQVIKDPDNDPLFRIHSGANLIDEFEWADIEEIDELALKLVNFGSFAANQANMKDEPTIYQWVYEIFIRTGNKGVVKFIHEEISKVTTNQWIEQFEIDSALLKLLEKEKKYLAFSEALSQYLSSLAKGELELKETSEFTHIAGSLFQNALDVESIILPKITQEYFELEDDNVKEKEFEFLKKYFEKHTKNIDPKYYMARISRWLEENNHYRLEWIIQTPLKPTKQPFEGLVERIKVAMASGDVDMMKIATALNLKLKIGLEVVQPEPEEPKA